MSNEHKSNDTKKINFKKLLDETPIAKIDTVAKTIQEMQDITREDLDIIHTKYIESGNNYYDNVVAAAYTKYLANNPTVDVKIAQNAQAVLKNLQESDFVDEKFEGPLQAVIEGGRKGLALWNLKNKNEAYKEEQIASLNQGTGEYKAKKVGQFTDRSKAVQEGRDDASKKLAAARAEREKAVENQHKTWREAVGAAGPEQEQAQTAFLEILKKTKHPEGLIKEAKALFSALKAFPKESLDSPKMQRAMKDFVDTNLQNFYNKFTENAKKNLKASTLSGKDRQLVREEIKSSVSEIESALKAVIKAHINPANLSSGPFSPQTIVEPTLTNKIPPFSTNVMNDIEPVYREIANAQNKMSLEQERQAKGEEARAKVDAQYDEILPIREKNEEFAKLMDRIDQNEPIQNL